MLKFEPPRHDLATFSDADLGAVDGLVQSLRWFESRASLLLYTWALHETLASEKIQGASTKPLTPDALYMLERYSLHSAIVELRALHDRNNKSLGSRQIFERLGEAEAREGLNRYLADFPQARAMNDVVERERYLDYIQRYTGLMRAPVRKSTAADHPLSAKTELVRRMANKTVAHSTLDAYTLGGGDLGEVVLASLVIACAIESAVGNAAISDDFATAESAGYRAAGSLLNVYADSEPYNVNMIRGFLPMWVRSGQEFPNYPSDFRISPFFVQGQK